MLKRLFGAEKARGDGALARTLKGLGSEDSNLETSGFSCHSLPDLTMGPACHLATDQRSGRREVVNISSYVNKTSEDSACGGSVCSDPGASLFQVNMDPAIMYCSVESLLAVPKAEIKRAPHSRGFSVKKTVATKRNSRADDLTDASAASSPRNSGIVTDASSAGNLLPTQSPTKAPVKKSQKNLEEVPRDRVPGLAAEFRAESTLAVQATKQSNHKSRKQRYKTLTGSELLVSAELQKVQNQDGAFQSDSENPAGAMGRSKPGWRSSSLKGTSHGKQAEVTVPLLKNEGSPANSLTTSLPTSKLDDYVVLASDRLEENGEIQAVKVDISKVAFPLTPEDLASYVEASVYCGKSLSGSLNNVALLLPARKSSSLMAETSLGQFTNTKMVCIAKGIVSVVQDAYSYSHSRFVFLTAEFLFIAKKNAPFKLLNKVAIGDLWLAPGLRRSGEVAVASQSSSLSFVIGWPLANNYMLIFTKAEQKNAWMTTLEKLIEVKRSDDAKYYITIQIVIEDTDVTVRKCLYVTCEVTVTQVIQRCLKEVHLAEADPHNYELCVKTKDGTTPLIGHELPYYIQRKNTPPSNRDADQPQVPAHNNDSGSNAFDHFVLRRRKTTLRNGVRQRPHKTRRITLTGLFGRGKPQPLPPQPDVVQSTPQAKLFGRSLAEVCADESLPKPVMDLLRRLYVQGASTPGIFRKPGNQRDLQELKVRLDAGEECNMDDISIHVAASALKSFLRDRPDCLLLSNLYCKWIEVIGIHDNGEKLENMKRLVSLLPPSNLMLLRHLVCVLHHISLHSERNHMTSSNLAICLGPTFLWPEGTVDLTSQFGSVDLVTRVAQAFIDDAQTIFGNDCLELFHDFDDKEPNAEPELNFESEDSFGSHELIGSKCELDQGASLESLDSVSFDDAQSSNAVQSQRSFDSGLAVSNPLLYDDPESPPPTTSGQAPLPFEGSRYAKRQLGGNKKKLHTKSELSDISEALTVLDLEERPNSKLARASNVRGRIHRFQASRAQSDEAMNDSGADNIESSEDEMMFARASVSSSENMADAFLGQNAENGFNRDLDDSLESEGMEETSNKLESSMVDITPENFLSEETERTSPSKNVIDEMDLTETAAQNSPERTERFEGTSSDWYFTGPENDNQLNLRNLRSFPVRDEKARNKRALLKKALQSEVASDKVSPVTSKLVPSKSLRHDRTVKGELDVRPVKQTSLDSTVPGVVSCPEMCALTLRKKDSNEVIATAQLRPRLTRFQIVDNAFPSAQRSPFNNPPSPDFLSSDSFVRVDAWPSTVEPCESVVLRQPGDSDVNVTDSGFRSSRGVQTDDFEVSVHPVVPSNRCSSRILVGDETDEVDTSRNDNSSAYKFGRRYKSDLDLASVGGNWNQELDSYSKDAGKKFTLPLEQRPQHSAEADLVQVSGTRRPLPVRITSEEDNYLPTQQRTPKQPARNGSFSREPIGSFEEQMKVFQKNTVPVSIEQRVRDRRSITVVRIGNEMSLLPSKYDSGQLHQPTSLQFPANGNLSSAATNQRLNEKRRNEFIPSDSTRKNLAGRQLNGSQSFDSASFVQESTAEKFTATPRMLPVQPPSSHGFSSTPLNSAAPQRISRQLATPRHTDTQGHVFGGRHFESQRDAVDHFYVSSSKTANPHKDTSQPNASRRRDGSLPRSSQHSNTPLYIDSQRHLAAQALDSLWQNTSPHVDTRRHDDVRYVSARQNAGPSRRPFDSHRNAETSQLTEMRSPSSTARMDEQSGVTWSVTELKKVFDSSLPNTRFSPSVGLVRRH